MADYGWAKIIIGENDCIDLINDLTTNYERVQFYCGYIEVEGFSVRDAEFEVLEKALTQQGVSFERVSAPVGECTAEKVVFDGNKFYHYLTDAAFNNVMTYDYIKKHPIRALREVFGKQPEIIPFKREPEGLNEISN